MENFELRSMWETEGFTIAREAFSVEQIDQFLDFYQKTLIQGDVKFTDFLHVKYSEVRDLICSTVLKEIFDTLGLEAGVEHSLLGWNYGPTKWHIDRIGTLRRVAGVIIALDHIPEESGSFQIIPGSHRFQINTESVDSQALQELAAQHQDQVFTFDGNKGDVLVWNTESLHRRAPKTGDVPRKAVIALYTPEATVRHGDGLPYGYF